LIFAKTGVILHTIRTTSVQLSSADLDTSRSTNSMAPDLNSVPAAPVNIASSSRPTSTSSSRRASQLMGPPPLPLASPGAILPQQSISTGQTPLPPPMSNIIGSTTSPDNAGVGIGPGQPVAWYLQVSPTYWQPVKDHSVILDLWPLRIYTYSWRRNRKQW